MLTRCKLACLLISLILLGGCWDAREIEDRVLVAAMAIDRHPKGVEVSIQVPIPLKIVGSGGAAGEGGQESVQVFSGTGKTMYEAVNQIQFQVNRRLFFGSNRLLLVGEDLAREGLSPYLDAFKRNFQIRRKLWTVVIKGKAKKALEINPKLEQVPIEYVITMLETGISDGYFPRVGLNDFYVALANPAKQAVLNYLDPESVRWIGTAIFQQDRMVGTLNSQETLSLVHIRDRQVGEPLSVPCGRSGKIVFTPDKIRRHIRVYQKKGPPTIQVTLDLNGEIVEKTCSDDLRNKSVRNRFDRSLKRAYQKKAEHVSQLLQRKMNSDAYQLGDTIRAYYPKLWEKIDWDKEFPHAVIKIKYNVKTLRNGLYYK